MNKRWLVILLLVVVAFGLGVAGVWLWARYRQVAPSGRQANQQKNVVVSWSPDEAKLIYKDEVGQEQTIVIKPLKPMVIVPVFENGKLVREETALVKKAKLGGIGSSNRRAGLSEQNPR